MTKREITDIVYDTLMENKQPPYEAFDLSKVNNQECDAQGDLILFNYRGIEVKIDISVRKDGVWL